MRVRIPAALQLWAAERHDQLSIETRAEVSKIASIIDESPLGDVEIGAPIEDVRSSFGELFTGERGERAILLLEVVATWVAEREAAEGSVTIGDTPGPAAEDQAGPASILDPRPGTPPTWDPAPAPVGATAPSMPESPA